MEGGDAKCQDAASQGLTCKRGERVGSAGCLPLPHLGRHPSRRLQPTGQLPPPVSPPARHPCAPEKYSADLQRRAPLVLQNVKANASELVHIGVVDSGEEADL